jgi:hypothetical protein
MPVHKVPSKSSHGFSTETDGERNVPPVAEAEIAVPVSH